MTKRQMYLTLSEMAEVKANPDVMAGINHELELLDKKNVSGKSNKANSDLNKKVLENAITIMKRNANTIYSPTTLAREVEKAVGSEVSTSRMSSVVRNNKDWFKVTKEKGKTYYQYNGAN